MFKRPLSLVLVAVSVPLFGGIAYAATQSVSSHPSPKVVIPTRPVTDDQGGTRGPSDDPTTHDVGDHAGALATTATTVAAPATHDVGDDHGDSSGGDTASTGGNGGSDDPATHDIGDDHGGNSGGDSRGDDDPATHDVGDDHGGN
jgi:hypothetical protein